jgi:hypothetical protein
MWANKHLVHFGICRFTKPLAGVTTEQLSSARLEAAIKATQYMARMSRL